MIKSSYCSVLDDRYFGDMKNGIADGFGVYCSNNGNKYIGSFKDGKINGNGISIYANGNKYKGEHLNDFRHGHGTIFFKDGGIFEGEHLNSKRNGFGIYVSPDKSVKSEGEYLDDKQIGIFCIVYEDFIYMGEVKDGFMHGYGSIEFKNGNKFEGIFEKGASVYGIYYYKSGAIFRGSFKGAQRIEGLVWTKGRMFKQRFEGSKIVKNEEIKELSSLFLTSNNLLLDLSLNKSIENRTFHTIQKENNTLVQLLEEKKSDCRKCFVCNDNKVNCILSCGHFLFCIGCIKKVVNCPLCRTKITGHTRFYD